MITVPLSQEDNEEDNDIQEDTLNQSEFMIEYLFNITSWNMKHIILTSIDNLIIIYFFIMYSTLFRHNGGCTRNSS